MKCSPTKLLTCAHACIISPPCVHIQYVVSLSAKQSATIQETQNRARSSGGSFAFLIVSDYTLKISCVFILVIVRCLMNLLSSAHLGASRFPHEKAKEEIFRATERPMFSDSLSTLFVIEYTNLSIIAVTMLASFELLICSTHWIVRMKIALSYGFKILNQRCLRMAFWRFRVNSVLESMTIHHKQI